MGGIAPNEEGTNNVSSNALQGLSNTQMQLDPTQRRFLPFNNNLPANMYGPVTTGKTYEDSPYFVQPLVNSGTTTTDTSTTGTSTTGTDTTDTSNSTTYTSTGFDDTLSVNSEVLTTDELQSVTESTISESM